MIKKLTKLAATVLLLGVFVTSCGKPPVEGAVAKVNDEYIMEEDVQKVLDQYKQMFGEEAFDESTEQGKNALAQIRPEIIDMLIRDRMMGKLQKDYNLEVTDEEVNEQAEMFKGQIGEENYEKMLEEQGVTEEQFRDSLKTQLEQSKLNEKLTKENAPSDEEVMDEINNNSDDYVEYDADHILISTKDEESGDDLPADKIKEKKALADDIYEKIQNGEDFEKLAKKYSDDPGTKEKGGALGTFMSGTMVKEFSDALDDMKPKEISKPVKSDFGYHIIRLNHKEEDFDKFTDEDKEQTKGMVKQKLTQENMEKFFEEKEDEMDIERY